MKFSSKLSLALAAALPNLVSVLASDVIDLTESTFQKEIAGEDLALVEFFAPWCGHCKNLAPHYEEAATELKEKNIKLAKVDCTVEQGLCGEFGVNGYPTLKVFRNGSPTDYAGTRKADGIVSYMTKQSLPAISEVTPESHDEFIKSDNVVLVAYGDDAHPVPEAFKEYAKGARDSYLFGQYLSSDLPSIPENPSLPAVVLYKDFDEGYAVFPSGEIAHADVDELSEFVTQNSMPLFDEITPENFGSYAEQGIPIAYLFADPNEGSAREKLVEELKPLAKELKGSVNFVYIDAIKFVDHGKSLNLPGDSWPAFVIQDLADQTKFPLTGKATAKAIKDFVKKYVIGEVPPSIKSESIPATQGPVYRLVADDWNNVYGDESKDVFAEFYAPWCGHCQRLAPIWDTLGEKYANNANIIIAQMDATENDIPPSAPFRVQGFPTLKFRPAGSSEFIDYTGDRSLDSLVEFVETHRKSGADVAEEEWEEEDEAPEHDEL
ncbi:protein disulfide-isomerase domain [Cryptococcus deuterogattii 99/473]|uniref:Protein disulfide-isomerase n=1 Tax=Cryptococcus deuterogattii Ram5 TaxID=1296110 RepID=A0A0D0SZV4_9TREE|nr:protein disulfide-isomerase domain [Cryptococcus deuterogattii Ram5]KIY57839.1 protein disulfide-isomerase domain [Cryptococcus deuterogattii 99/473]